MPYLMTAGRHVRVLSKATAHRDPHPRWSNSTGRAGFDFGPNAPVLSVRRINRAIADSVAGHTVKPSCCSASRP